MKKKRLTYAEIEKQFTAERVMGLLHRGHTVVEIAKMMTRSRSNTVRWIHDHCKVPIPTRTHTDAYALMCHEYGLNAAEFLRARNGNKARCALNPVRYKLINGNYLVFQPGMVRGAHYFLHKDFLDRTLPIGFSATLFQRICRGHSLGKVIEFHGSEKQMGWLISNNTKSMAHIYKLIMGKIPKERG